jgi:hypothetical protein
LNIRPDFKVMQTRKYHLANVPAKSMLGLSVRQLLGNDPKWISPCTMHGWCIITSRLLSLQRPAFAINK